MNKNISQIDSIFSDLKSEIKDFAFDESVAEVFSDMINRSVPGYYQVIQFTGLLAKLFSKPNTHLYDLGCSIGDSSISMAKHASLGSKVISVDNSFSMLNKFEEKISSNSLPVKIELICDDVCHIPISNASMISLNYTLQFIPIELRNKLLEKIYNGMLDNGILILSEKVKFECTTEDNFFIDLHHRFKSHNGYSDIEISQKREALEDVLIPESLLSHQARLTKCGFKKIFVWHQCLNFFSMIAIK